MLSNPPQLATAALVVALVAVTAHDGLGIYSALRARAGAPGPDRPRPLTSQRASIATVSGAHLFGAPPPVSSGAIEVSDTMTTLVLTGTFATPDPAMGYALVGETAASARLHAAGSSIAQGVLLRSVYQDHITVDSGGRLANVFLPRGAHYQSLLASNSGAVDRDESPQDPQRDEPGPEQIRAQMESESLHMAAVMRETPYYSGDQLRGIRVEPGNDPGLLGQLGLKPGDVVHHVDGTMILDPARLGLLRTRLASGRPVTVSVTRPGSGTLDLTIDSTLVAGLVEK